MTPAKRKHNFKGGSITNHGYRIQYVGKDHHLADVRGYAYEHRLEAEKKIGRQLEPGEIVHHADENPLNNAHDNLIVTKDMAAHRLLHRKASSNLQLPGEENPLIDCDCGCGKTFLKFDNLKRPRRYMTGHNLRPEKRANLLP